MLVHRPLRLRHRPGHGRADPQLAAGRLLPDRQPAPGVLVPPRRQRRRRVHRPDPRRCCWPRALSWRAPVLRLRHPDVHPGPARPAPRRSRAAASRSARPWASPTPSAPRSRRRRSPRAGGWCGRSRACGGSSTPCRSWPPSLIGFSSLAAILYEQKFGLDEVQRGWVAAAAEPAQLVGLVDRGPHRHQADGHGSRPRPPVHRRRRVRHRRPAGGVRARAERVDGRA